MLVFSCGEKEGERERERHQFIPYSLNLSGSRVGDAIHLKVWSQSNCAFDTSLESLDRTSGDPKDEKRKKKEKKKLPNMHPLIFSKVHQKSSAVFFEFETLKSNQLTTI